MSDLKLNTIIGTGLASLLVVMGLRTVAEGVFHPHFPEKPGYEIDISGLVSEGGAGGGEKEKEGPLDWGRLLADPALVPVGEKIAQQKCASCHTFTQGGPNLTGPNQWELVNRVAGSHPGFTYSAAMQAFAQPWTYDHLNEFISGPGKYVKGTTMSFVGIKKQEDRTALLAYLRTLAPTPAPLPAPLPEEAPAEAAAPAETAAPAEGGEAPAAQPAQPG